MAEEAFIKSTFSFTTKLFKEVCKEFKTHDHYLYSPLSIQSCLTMVYMGAEGATADSIAQVLEYDTKLNKVDIAYFIKMLMEQGEEDESVEVANAILVDSSIKVSNLYQKIMKTYFHSSIEPLNHQNDEKLLKSINKWISGATHGRITEILDKSDLVHAGTKERKKLVLLDSIYFKGQWACQFDKNLTKKAKFWINKDEFVTVDTMEIINHFNYCRFDNEKFSVLELNYVNSELSLLIFIPDEADKLPIIEELADKLDIFDVVKHLYLKTVHVYLPKFKLEFKLDLKKALSNIGMEGLFKQNANLNGIFDEKKENGMGVDSIIHKAVIIVDEQGAPPRDKDVGEVEVVFQVDKPFFFCVKHKFEHNVVFSGCVKKL